MILLRKYACILICTHISILSIFAQTNEGLLKDSGWSSHFQFTGILQGHLAFTAPYRGKNSLHNDYEQAYSVTSTLYFGRRLWKGASLYFNPEMAGGTGISSTVGIAGFPNGETFRIGDPAPTVYIGRAFFRQHIFLDKEHVEEISEGVNQIKENCLLPALLFLREILLG